MHTLTGLYAAAALLWAIEDPAQETRRGEVVSTLNRTVIVTIADQQQPQSFQAAAECVIMRNGQPSKLGQLKARDRVTLTLAKGDLNSVVKIEAVSGPTQGSVHLLVRARELQVVLFVDRGAVFLGS